MMRRTAWRPLMTMLVAGVAVAGCEFRGVATLPLPGTVGTGPGSYVVEIELPDAGNLRPNAQVKVDDVAVGTVTALRARDWIAVATLSLDEDLELPANAVAAVGQNSLLGSSYLELGVPTTEPASGALGDGDLIPLARTMAYPTTEQVLSAASVVLNGGGLNQLSTVTRELNRALGGEDGAVGRLLPRLEELVSGLDAQRDDILLALDGLDRLSGELAGDADVIREALAQLGPAFAVLNDERDDLTGALASLRALSATGSDVVQEGGEDLTANLRDLEPVLGSVADAQDQLLGALEILVTFPFPSATVPDACRGDYCNLSLNLDLQLSSLDAGLLAGTPLEGTLFGVDALLGALPPGNAGGAADPLAAPLTGAAPPTTGGAATGVPPTPDPEPAPGDEGLLGSLLGGGR